MSRHRRVGMHQCRGKREEEKTMRRVEKKEKDEAQMVEPPTPSGQLMRS